MRRSLVEKKCAEIARKQHPMLCAQCCREATGDPRRMGWLEVRAGHERHWLCSWGCLTGFGAATVTVGIFRDLQDCLVLFGKTFEEAWKQAETHVQQQGASVD